MYIQKNITFVGKIKRARMSDMHVRNANALRNTTDNIFFNSHN